MKFNNQDNFNTANIAKVSAIVLIKKTVQKTKSNKNNSRFPDSLLIIRFY